MIRLPRWSALPALLAVPAPALAQLMTTLAATGQYQYNSNVFDLERGFTYSGLGLRPQLYDSDFSYAGALDLKDQWQQQAWYADATASRYDYKYYSQLNHTEYRLDLGWNGHFTSLWDGNFEVLRNHTMVPFLDVFQSTLTVSTEQREQGGIGLQFTPDWRLEGSAYTHILTYPLPDEPNLAVDESQGQVALKYVGVGGWAAGLSASYLTGHYSGDTTPPFNPSYYQRTEDLVVNYTGGRANLISSVGYSDRASPGAFNVLNDISGITGTIDYTNQLTGKTSVQLLLARTINTYITNSGSEIDNSATARANWQATYRTNVALSYVWDYAEFPGQGDNPSGSTRLDHVQTVAFTVTYQVFRWLVIKPYANYQHRVSDLVGASFDDWIGGANLTAQWQK